MWSSTFFDESGRPSFNRLQNYGSSSAPVYYYVFDVPILAGRDLRSQPLHARRDLLEKHVLPKLQDPVRYSVSLSASLPELMQAVRAQGLEGLVAKRRDSVYESGQRSGAWRKMRLNQGQDIPQGNRLPLLGPEGELRQSLTLFLYHFPARTDTPLAQDLANGRRFSHRVLRPELGR